MRFTSLTSIYTYFACWCSSLILTVAIVDGHTLSIVAALLPALIAPAVVRILDEAGRA